MDGPDYINRLVGEAKPSEDEAVRRIRGKIPAAFRSPAPGKARKQISTVESISVFQFLFFLICPRPPNLTPKIGAQFETFRPPPLRFKPSFSTPFAVRTTPSLSLSRLLVMAGSSKSSQPKPRKRVEAETTLKRARDGSAFIRCEGCSKDVPVATMELHDCFFDAKIRKTLEAQVVEQAVEVKKKSSERKRAASSEPKDRKGKKGKNSNVPSKLKRPPTAFFLFMNDFRKSYKEANPDSKSVSAAAKEGGEKWKSMTEEEKKPYLDKAAELKAEYQKAVEGNTGNEEGNVDNGDGNAEAGEENAENEEHNPLDDY